MELTEKINSCSRTKGNELNKGYYPTFSADIELVKKVVSISFGWDRTSIHQKMVTIFDPCAGEGIFLSAMVRHARRAATESNAKNTEVASYAIELDAERFSKIRGTDLKLHSSFFNTTNSGAFDILLLNPPYNRNGGELISWVEKAGPMVAKRGVMFLIIPEYELKGKMIELLRGSFTFRYAYRSRRREDSQGQHRRHPSQALRRGPSLPLLVPDIITDPGSAIGLYPRKKNDRQAG